MTIATYDDLKAKIVRILARSDISATDPEVDDYIQLFEAYANTRLRHRKMEKTISSLAAVLNVITLPTDFLEVSTIASNSRPRALTYYPRTRFNDLTLNQGLPDGYTIDNASDGSDIIRVDAGGFFGMTYYARLPGLSSTVATNWLLKRYPDAYITGAVYFGFRTLRNALAADYKALMDEAIDTLNTESEKTTGGGGGMRSQVQGTIV